MSKMSKSQSNIQTIYSISLSSETARFKKCLSLSKFNTKGSDDFIMVDIRRFVNGIPTKSGVCFTPYEFDWFANCILLANTEKNNNFQLSGKESLRKIVLNFKPNKSLEIIQYVDDRI